jgi:hypothetical protein
MAGTFIAVSSWEKVQNELILNEIFEIAIIETMQSTPYCGCASLTGGVTDSGRSKRPRGGGLEV